MSFARTLRRKIDKDAVKRALSVQEIHRRAAGGKRTLTLKQAYVLSITPATVGNFPGGHELPPKEEVPQ